MNEALLRIMVLAAAAVQIIAPGFLNPFRDGQNALRISEPSQIEPAAYAFTIWGPIYLLALGYAIWQLTPAGRLDPATAKIAPFAIILYIGSTVWLAAAKYGPLWATMPILAVMTLCACLALLAAVYSPNPAAWRPWIVTLPFAIYTGWTCCATFVNIAEVAPGYGFGRFGLSVPGYAILSLAAAALLASIMLWLSAGQLAFAGTVVWALVAIIAAAATRGAATSVTVTAAIAIVVVLAMTAVSRRFGPEHAVSVAAPEALADQSV
ncbi:MAG: hypothetical protein HC850_14005 [Rhodomicrobium sp.]|nr:hypothetical protein [Rhodomicrobium sp.]